MFQSGTLYHPKKFSQMQPQCPECGQSFNPEPGFYFGAMFISYALNTALFICTWISMALLMEEVSIDYMLAVILSLVIVLLPITYRLSRSIWIHIFVKYQKKNA
ncbi:DUF983 domain-containing protein [Echinicola sediminis]